MNKAKLALTLATAVFVSLCSALPAFAQKSADDDIERIEVLGQKSLLHLRNVMAERGKVFMTSFNDLVADPDLRFVCDRYVPINSNYKREGCSSAFEKRIRDKEFENLRLNYADDIRPDIQRLRDASYLAELNTGEVIKKRQEQAEVLKNLLEENPQLRADFLAYYEAKQAFEAKKYGRN